MSTINFDERSLSEGKFLGISGVGGGFKEAYNEQLDKIFAMAFAYSENTAFNSFFFMDTRSNEIDLFYYIKDQWVSASAIPNKNFQEFFNKFAPEANKLAKIFQEHHKLLPSRICIRKNNAIEKYHTNFYITGKAFKDDPLKIFMERWRSESLARIMIEKQEYIEMLKQQEISAEAESE